MPGDRAGADRLEISEAAGKRERTGQRLPPRLGTALFCFCCLIQLCSQKWLRFVPPSTSRSQGFQEAVEPHCPTPKPPGGDRAGVILPAGRPCLSPKRSPCGRLAPLGAHQGLLSSGLKSLLWTGHGDSGQPCVYWKLGYYLEFVCFSRGGQLSFIGL